MLGLAGLQAKHQLSVHLGLLYARIEIDFGQGERRLFEGELKGDEFLLQEALKSVAQEAKFNYSANRGKIQSIAGVTGTWEIYKNGDLQNLSFNELVTS